MLQKCLKLISITLHALEYSFLFYLNLITIVPTAAIKLSSSVLMVTVQTDRHPNRHTDTTDNNTTLAMHGVKESKNLMLYLL